MPRAAFFIDRLKFTQLETCYSTFPRCDRQCWNRLCRKSSRASWARRSDWCGRCTSISRRGRPGPASLHARSRPRRRRRRTEHLVQPDLRLDHRGAPVAPHDHGRHGLGRRPVRPAA
ncbi:MAG: hypothetical protein B7Z55_16770, partial [Planctomycetales bacterium 12-60-4]